MFALPILEPESEAWFAQNLDDFLAAYDWTVPMAMPLMESVPAGESNARLTRLVKAVAARPGALNKTILSYRRGLGAETAACRSRWTSGGVDAGAPAERHQNYGYYPDDFLNNQPDISRIRPEFSSYWYPDND